MGRTYKDQNKWDRKRNKRDDDMVKEPRKTAKNRLDEIIPADDELAPYEEYDIYEDYG
jgi:hypothetical protein